MEDERRRSDMFTMTVLRVDKLESRHRSKWVADCWAIAQDRRTAAASASEQDS